MNDFKVPLSKNLPTLGFTANPHKDPNEDVINLSRNFNNLKKNLRNPKKKSSKIG